MSVILEGKIALDEVKKTETTDGILTGKWKFMKDNKQGSLNFSYNKVGTTVPRCLLNYVSFIDDGSNPIRNNRGRKPYKKSHLAKSNTTNTTTTDSKITAASVEDLTKESGEALESSDAVDNEEEGVDNSGVTNNDITATAEMEEETIESSKDTTYNTLSIESILPSSSTFTDVATTATLLPDVELPTTHSLFGYYEGSFEVMTHGGIVHTNESFFFCSLLKEEEGEATTEINKISNSKITSTNTNAENMNVNSTSIEEKTISEVEVDNNNDVINTLEGDLSLLPPPPYFSSTIQKSMLVTSTTTSDAATDVLPVTVTTPAASVIPLAATIKQAKKTIQLYGFGRNQFGRFSILGIVDEESGLIFCEKKYLLTKLGNSKRGRLSADGVEGTLPPPLTHQYSKRHSTGSSHTNGGVGKASVHVDGSLILSDTIKRRRTESSKFKDFEGSSGDNLNNSYSSGDGGYMSNAAGGNSGISTSGSLLLSKQQLRLLKESSNKNNSISSSSSSYYADNNSTAQQYDEYYSNNNNNDNIYNNNDDELDDDSKSYVEGLYDEDNGEIYEGYLYQRKRHGLGLLLRLDGTLYEGPFVLGKEQGRGKLMRGLDREIIYEGDFFEGLFSGYGILRFPMNGDVYTGEFKEGLRNGKGEYISHHTGCKYIGDWKENKRHGKGKFYWADGSVYEGDWENDMRHGRGILELVNCFRYDGYWSHNYPEGKGWGMFANGQEYQGSYKQGCREGRGSITFPEGAVYEGRFRGDKIDGMGTVKVTHVVPGAGEGELYLPVQVQADIKRIHLRAGFGADSH